MPILDVEIVLRPKEAVADDLAKQLADRVGSIFGSNPGQTWVKLRPLPANHYAENESDAEVHPVFVSVLKARRPSPEQLETEAAKIVTAVAEVCHRPPENVHVLFLPDGAGRIAFGGRIVPEN